MKAFGARLYSAGMRGAALEVDETPTKIPEDGIPVVIRTKAEDDARTAALEAFDEVGFCVFSIDDQTGRPGFFRIPDSTADLIRSVGLDVRRLFAVREP